MVRVFELPLTGLFLSFFVVIVQNCGLPNSAYVNVNNLNKPHVEIYNRGNTLYFEITGYYPPDEYPDFLGYNIYVGDNNNIDKVIDRVMYISQEVSLPSYRVSTSDGSRKITVSLSEVRFRYSRHAKAEDIPEGVERTAFFSKPLVTNERYYFVVEPVENTRTGIRTEAIKHVFVHYETDQQWDYDTPLTGVDSFNGLMAKTDFFVLPTSSAHTYMMGSGGAGNSVYQTIPENDSVYSDNPYKPYDQHIYFFRSTPSNGVKQYLLIWVESVTADGLTISYAHYSRENFPNFVNGVTQIY